MKPSERFPDPPAPKLVAGYDLIRQFGCFGCHEINGFDGPIRRHRARHARRAELRRRGARRCWPPATERRASVDLAETIVEHPDHETGPHTLWPRSAIRRTTPGRGARCRWRRSRSRPTLAPADASAGRSVGRRRNARQATARLGPACGTWRASSIRFSCTPGFATRRISAPRRRCRSSSGWAIISDAEMCRDESYADGKVDARSRSSKPIEDSRQSWPISVGRASRFVSRQAGQGVTEEASAERGKQLFEVRGCLACHQHNDFPRGQMNAGPEPDATSATSWPPPATRRQSGSIAGCASRALPSRAR